ncbi:hypothetical protein SMICM304S_02557 [Streptomyces microflavus]
MPLLADRNIGLTLVSPSIRARRTAELAGLHAPRVTPELREWDYGGYEGIATLAIRRTRPFWNLWTDGVDPGSDEHPGESPADVGQRADQVLAGVRSAAEGLGDADIALVAHSHFLRVLTTLPRPDPGRGPPLPARHRGRLPARHGTRPAGHRRTQRGPARKPARGVRRLNRRRPAPRPRGTGRLRVSVTDQESSSTSTSVAGPVSTSRYCAYAPGRSTEKARVEVPTSAPG